MADPKPLTPEARIEAYQQGVNPTGPIKPEDTPSTKTKKFVRSIVEWIASRPSAAVAAKDREAYAEEVAKFVGLAKEDRLEEAVAGLPKDLAPNVARDAMRFDPSIAPILKSAGPGRGVPPRFTEIADELAHFGDKLPSPAELEAWKRTKAPAAAPAATMDPVKPTGWTGGQTSPGFDYSDPEEEARKVGYGSFREFAATSRRLGDPKATDDVLKKQLRQMYEDKIGMVRKK